MTLNGMKRCKKCETKNDNSIDDTISEMNVNEIDDNRREWRKTTYKVLLDVV